MIGMYTQKQFKKMSKLFILFSVGGSITNDI